MRRNREINNFIDFDIWKGNGGKGYSLSEKSWRSIIIVSTAAAVLLTVLMLVYGITTVFIHFYYIPIVLLAYHYRMRGVIFSILLGITYILLLFLFVPYSPVEIEAGLVRVFVFVCIAVLVAYLSEVIYRSHNTLRKVAEIQQSSMMNAQVWLMILDARGRIYLWNNAAERISGYPSRDVIGRNAIWKLLYPDKSYRDEITGMIERIIAENNFLENFETRINCKNGDLKILSWNTRLLPIEDDVDPKFISIGIDVTKRRKAENALKENEEYYRSVFENTGAATCIIDEDTTIVQANDQFISLSGYSRAELEGRKSWNEFVVQEDLERMMIQHRLRRNNRKDALKRYEFQFVRNNGEIRNIFLYIDLISGTKRSVASLIDITDHKKTEEALRRSLEDKNALIHEIHHRVKNNISIIMGFIILQKNIVEDPDVKSMLQELESRIIGLDTSQDLIYQYESFSRIDAQMHFYHLINNLLISNGMHKDIGIDVDTGGAEINVPLAITTSLITTEIVLNSLKHAFKEKDKGTICLKFRETGDYYELIVSDDGIGVLEPSELFKTRTVGIKIVQKVVTEQLKGTYEVTDGKGITWTIRFPKKKS